MARARFAGDADTTAGTVLPALTERGEQLTGPDRAAVSMYSTELDVLPLLR